MSVIIDGSNGITYPITAGGTSPTQAASSKILQVVSTTLPTTFSMSGASFVTITGLTASITPIATTSKILVKVSLGRVAPNTATGQTVAVRLLRDSTAIGVGTPSGSQIGTSFVVSSSTNANYSAGGITFQYLDSPSSISAITYGVQILGESSVTVYINRSYTGGTTSATYDSLSASTITVTEIAA
jgi:hypothetical protein